jgi:hypothetical protein
MGKRSYNQQPVGGLEHVFFSIQLGRIIPTDFHIVQRGMYTTNQSNNFDVFECIMAYGNVHQIGENTIQWENTGNLWELYISVNYIGILMDKLCLCLFRETGI